MYTLSNLINTLVSFLSFYTSKNSYCKVNSGGWGRPLLTPGVLSAGSLVPQVTALDMENWGKNNKGQASKMKIKVSQNKVPEYREEMVIRNSDSGKSYYLHSTRKSNFDLHLSKITLCH